MLRMIDELQMRNTEGQSNGAEGQSRRTVLMRTQLQTRNTQGQSNG